MLCAHCATPVPDGARYCHSCGSLVSDAEGQAAATAAMDASSLQHLEVLLRDETRGEFEIVRLIGRGGMAVVYLAREVHLARNVAIKVLPPELTFGHGIERFKREAKTAAALDHPNIIPIYRIASGGSLFWYAMKYLQGKSLDQLLKERGSLGLDETLRILSQVADALDYAHEHQVVHRDVKPANVMLDARTRVIVTDFGIAKALTEGTLTASGSVIGTPYFMSPEQGLGKPVTGASDQYAVAVMAYRMLSGQVPFEGDSAIDILHKHCMIPPPPLETLVPSLPRHVYLAVHRALEKAPERRFPTVTDFVEAMRRAPGAALSKERTSESNVDTLVVESRGPEIAEGVTPLVDTPSRGIAAPRPPSGTGAGAAAPPAAPTATGAPPPKATPARARIAPTRPLPARPTRRRRWIGVTAAVLAVGAVGVGAVVLLWGPLGGGGSGSVERRQDSSVTAGRADSLPSGQAVTPPAQAAPRTAPAVTPPAAETTAAGPPAPLPATGTVRVTNLPPGATVRVDRTVRRPPVEITAGQHVVEIDAPGYQRQTDTVEVVAGERLSLRFASVRVQPQEPPRQPPVTVQQQPAAAPTPAPPATAVLRIRVTPPARIAIDGSDKGEKGQLVVTVEGGVAHLLSFVPVRPGFTSKDTTVTPRGGDTVTISIRLEARQ